MEFADLTDDQHKELLRIARVYKREADKCRESKAYLAGCIMLGAALEASLLALVDIYPEEVAGCEATPKRKGVPKPLLEWSLAELIQVARQLGWLPAKLALEEDFDHKRAEIGDYIVVLREIRNLVHPARYLQDFPNKRITIRYLEMSANILDAAIDQMLERVELSLLEARAEEAREHND